MLVTVYSRRMKALQEKVAQVYYTHGLFCASHPLSIICGVICLAVLACYPLTNLPLPGNTPVEVNTPIKEYFKPTPGSGDKWKDDLIKQRWYLSQPVAYVQQVVVKGTVSPWESVAMLPTDALRGPLSKVFTILNTVTNFKIANNDSTVSVDDVCLRVSEVVSNKRVKGFLPEYNCLIISPANFWRGDFTNFKADPDELKTINKMYSQPLETPPTLQDLLFGVPWKKTGMSRYFIRNKRRTITYAITIMYKTFNPKFTEALKEKLEALYPQSEENVNSTDVEYLVHIQYKDINYFVEYTPLLAIYFVLLLYIYFSVRKIEMVKSKWGLAFSAVATVIASLFMSVSICTLFGLTPTLNGGEIFPYLVVIIGLENVIVLTKSVVSTPVHLDVKYRVAQGLSKEGWSITKNLVWELLIILVGFFTFVPAIQEFCIFAVVGLLSDFFLQIVFFATVLSVDIRRMELSDLQKQSIQQEMSSEELSFPVIEPLIRCPVMTRMSGQSRDPTTPTTGCMPRSTSAPGLDTIGISGTPPSPPYEVEDNIFPSPTILPRRLRFLYFWASIRMFQRAIMVCTVIWIGLIMYKTGLVEKLTAASESLSSHTDSMLANSNSAQKGVGLGGPGADQGGHWVGPAGSSVNYWSSEAETVHGNHKEEEQNSEHGDLELWRHLSFKHWRTLLRYYNISFTGRHISILPSIHLSVTISPEEAIQIRHPNKAKVNNNMATDKPSVPPKQPSHHGISQKPSVPPLGLDVPLHSLKLFYPQGMKELIITVVLAILSTFLLFYFLVILYKCCCSRNYDKWRTSWVKKSRRTKEKYFRQIQNSVPLILKGHSLEIECISTDGPLVVSSCLGGQLRVWDSNSGDCVTVIHRRSVTPPMKRKPCVGRNVEDSDADLYAEFHGETDLPENQKKFGIIRTDFSTRRSPETNVPFAGVDAPMNFPRSGAGDGPGIPRRRLQTMPDQHMSERGEEESRLRSWSAGSNMSQGSEVDHWCAPAVWCIVCQDNLIVCGCGNGRIEFWDSLTGVLRYVYDDCKEGVTCICVNGIRIMAARMNGEIDFLELETFQNPAKSLVQPVAVLHNRGHVRHVSGQIDTFSSSSWEEVIHYSLIERTHAHQQPINSLQSVGGRVVSASIDNTLKVFRLEDCVCLYTLYGHLGSVTALYLDKGSPYAAASGSVDGTVRLWDLVTGACVHKMKGHTGVVTTLTCTNQFVISSGQDDMLCVWERGHGQLIHRIPDDGCGFTSLAMIFSNILVTGGESCICLWDIVKGEMVKKVFLGSQCRPATVNSVQVIGKTTVVCDYSNEIHIVQFPIVLEKTQ